MHCKLREMSSANVCLNVKTKTKLQKQNKNKNIFFGVIAIFKTCKKISLNFFFLKNQFISFQGDISSLSIFAWKLTDFAGKRLVIIGSIFLFIEHSTKKRYLFQNWSMKTVTEKKQKKMPWKLLKMWTICKDVNLVKSHKTFCYWYLEFLDSNSRFFPFFS